ncbi:hypothetical protein [Actinoplanes sp. NPDC049599]|uniref:hypothetical protein n=1 Tax=Actinoplanes sp. NPDC049599 TaxID=3363903 RepID=UPI0037A60596
MRREAGRRKLRGVLAFNGKPSHIVTATFNLPLHGGVYGAQPYELPPTPMIGADDLFASALAIEVSRRAGSDPLVTSATGVELGANAICIGGWSGNAVSDSLLRVYCRGFIVINRQNEFTNFDSIRYECGGSVFQDDKDTAHGFLVKLSPKMTGLDGPVFMLWGHHGIGTLASANYLSTHYGALYRLQRDSFFIVLRISKSLGYRASSNHFVDISQEAFEPQGNPTVDGN